MERSEIEAKLVDLLVDRIVVSRDEISVEFAENRDSEGAEAPSSPNPLPTQHSSESSGETKTIRRGVPEDDDLPKLLTVKEVAGLLRTSTKSVYSMIERDQLPGVASLGRRVLVQRDDLLRWLDESRASSLKERRA